MALIDDINNLPSSVQENTTNHLSHHKTIHAALKNHAPRVTALEAMNGVSPESPVDGQTASLLLQDDTMTHAAVSDFIGDDPVPQLALPDVKWIETFQPGHGWTNPGTTGSFSADPTNRVMGTQSLKISGGSVRKTIPYIDLTRYHLTLLVRTGEMETTNQSMTVYVSDHQELYRSRSHAPLIGGAPSPWHRPGEWMLITIPNYNYTQGSTPVDMTNITTLQVRVNGGADVWVQAIGITPRTDAVVSVSFDDGYSSVIEAARRSMTPRGIRGTSYTITHAVGNQNFMTMEETRELHDIHGWEIQAHTSKFYSYGGDNTEVYAQMREARRWLSRNGFGSGVHFAYAGGMSAPDNELVSRKTYQSARTISGNVDTIPPARPHRMRAMTAVGGVNGYSPNSVNNTIDRIKEQGGWLHLVFHRIVEGPSTRAEDCSFDDLEEILDHLLETGVPVKTVSEALAQVSTAVDAPKVAVFRGLPTLVADMWRSLEKVSGSGAVVSTGHRVRAQDPGEYRITYTSVSAEDGERIVREATPGGGEQWLTWADGEITEEITFTEDTVIEARVREVRVRNAPEDIVITIEAI